MPRLRVLRALASPFTIKSTSRALTRSRVPRVLATLFTIASAVWTLYSVWDLLGIGPVAITAGAGAEGLWVGGMLAYRAKPTRLTATAMIVGLVATLAILAVHGFGAYHWGGIVAIVPPLAAELFWHVDAQLSADPTELTPDQQDEVDDVIRQARHITARAAADQAREDAEHAAKLARIRRDGQLRQAEDLADFEVAVSRIDMQRQITRRAPLMLPAPPDDGPDWDGPGPAPQPAALAKTVMRGEAPADMPQVSGLPLSEAIPVIHRRLTDDVSAKAVVTCLALQGMATDTGYVRTALARARLRAHDEAFDEDARLAAAARTTERTAGTGFYP
ncbi:hypothetical protein [Kitasatospora indigofera]|uniref:hypothetical protein n=1 Tax=Kitasatospora indigofera TaxID=67307 RepID=UPI0036BFC397